MADKETCDHCGKTGLKGKRGKSAHESKCMKNPKAKCYQPDQPPEVEEPEITEEQALAVVDGEIKKIEAIEEHIEEHQLPEVQEPEPSPAPTPAPEEKQPEPEKDDPESDDWIKWVAIGLIIIGIICAVFGAIWFWQNKKKEKELRESAKQQQSEQPPQMAPDNVGTPP